MESDWKAFLKGTGANFRDNSVSDFGNGEDEAGIALSGDIITDLSCFAVLEVTGSDAGDFLHAQFTSEVRGLVPGHFHISAWCNPKGRMLANFILFQQQDKYFLILPGELKEHFIKRLQMYILRADVTIHDRSEALARIGVRGINIGQTIQSAADTIPAKVFQVAENNGVFLLSLPDESKRMMIIGPLAALEKLWREIAESVTAIGSRYWHLFDILSGLPWIGISTREEYLPQQLNLDGLGGLSYNKGCFPGQEVIARLRYRGTLKQRMYLATVNEELPAAGGDGLYTPDNDQKTGTIINATGYPGTGTAMLAVIGIDQAQKNHVHLGDAKGPVLNFESTPYAIE